jgi:hypothetical protein
MYYVSTPTQYRKVSYRRERTNRSRKKVEEYLTGASEASELIYFKVYKSQVPVIEQALEIAARMLGSDKSRGYCLERFHVPFLSSVIRCGFHVVAGENCALLGRPRIEHRHAGCCDILSIAGDEGKIVMQGRRG